MVGIASFRSTELCNEAMSETNKKKPQTKAFEDRVGGREYLITEDCYQCSVLEKVGKGNQHLAKDGPSITFQQNWELMTDGLSKKEASINSCRAVEKPQC